MDMWSFRGDSSTSLLPLIQSWYQPVLLYELKANAFVGVSADVDWEGGGRCRDGNVQVYVRQGS